MYENKAYENKDGTKILPYENKAFYSIEEIPLDQTIIFSVKLEQKREEKSKPAKKRHGNTL